jgi:hypothetical protein
MSYPIRVVIAGLPALPADLVHHTLSAEPDLGVVATVSEPSALAPTLRVQRTDVLVVWSAFAEFVDAALELLPRHPRLRLLILADDGEAFIEARVLGIPALSWQQDLITAIRRPRTAPPGRLG